MYVTIGTETYTSLSGLKFEPETDVTGSTVPVNELEADVKTDDEIVVGSRVSLYDDLDNLWAKYWVTYADRVDKTTVRVKGQSALKQLERDMLDPVMYSGELVSNILPTVLARLDGEYSLDSSFTGKTVTGFCPKQTARNRLQWICMAIGAYVKNFFNDELEILPVPTSYEIVPANKTYWKPSVTYGEYVTAVRAVYYSYVETVPSTTDKWVEANGRYYVQTEHEATLRNPDAPSSALEHVISVEGVTIVNQSNVDEILSHLSQYYFSRTEVSFEAIDNGEYMPGQRLVVNVDESTVMAGYVNSCSFTFGTQAKARMTMTAADGRESALVTVAYTWDGTQVGKRSFRFPVGYVYDIASDYIDLSFNEHRYIFRPTVASVTGTVAAGGNSHTVPVEVALDYHDGDLYVRSVDDLSFADGILAIA